MRRSKLGYTERQGAYAMNKLGGSDKSKTKIALRSGYAPSVAIHATEKIEDTEGYANAMSALASQNGNLALKVYYDLLHRDLSKESVKTLLDALTTLASAWQVYTPKVKDENDNVNKLRSIVLNRIENQTINQPVASAPAITAPIDDDDF
ncbi:MAG: hypothetical protein V4509_00480 [Patescibacteria group bacterium]